MLPNCYCTCLVRTIHAAHFWVRRIRLTPRKRESSSLLKLLKIWLRALFVLNYSSALDYYSNNMHRSTAYHQWREPHFITVATLCVCIECSETSSQLKPDVNNACACA
eukprot:54845-Pleurochrysis_carterae.AAC.4